MTFTAAQNDAISKGGYLATITTLSELSFVANYLNSVISPNAPFMNAWIGGQRLGGVFQWINGPETGTPLTLGGGFWHAGQPSGDGPFVHMLRSPLNSNQILFNDISGGDSNNSGYV